MSFFVQRITQGAKLLLFLSILLLSSCGNDTSERDPGIEAALGPLLRKIGPDSSGIRFANDLMESPEVNYFTYVYAYNGAGVAVGDVNNDGLPDLYFTGNQVPDRLYLNRGDLRFEDVTDRSIGHLAGEGWRTGVTMADVNGDGWLDVYVCRSGPTSDTSLTRNLLYMNNGDLTFTERARELGVADTTHSTQAAFFDHDGDGDQDLFILNTPPNRIRNLSNFTALRVVREHRAPTGRLLRNDGTRFIDITYDADVQHFIYGLGLGVADLDLNGKLDIYLACDFDSPDLMYMNTGDGNYVEQLQGRTRHTSNFGMGCDVADMNNDGLPDIVVLDMTAPDHVRNKTNMGSMSPDQFWANVRGGYFFQYMVNSLQLNNGNGSFSEIGQLAGIARTDWSWAPLFADLDNDGWKDLLITNGYKHDVRDNDYQRTVYGDIRSGADYYAKLDLIPSTRLRNYLFRNNHDLTFADSSQAWGFTEAENSNGAAYADLDNDGDLDLVINNIDQIASLYENTARQQVAPNHFLRLDLRIGTPKGKGWHAAIGAKAFLRTKGKVQYQELQPSRGFQSSVDQLLHFGLGTEPLIDSLEIHWPNGKYMLLTGLNADQVLVLDQQDATRDIPMPATQHPLFEEVSARRGLKWTHRENAYDDFKIEVLLPHKQSEQGPLLGTGDANGDGLGDVFVSGAHGQSSALWLQNTNGSFSPSASQPWGADALQEQLGSVFFDADGDSDQDLLVLAGSNEHDIQDPIFTQRLYLNDGKGGFHKADDHLPEMHTSGHRAAAADVDNDGDTDLFIGGRVTPGLYPFPPRSYLLVNDGTGHFGDATDMLAAGLKGPGMVTGAQFGDIDGDRDQDLILVGEWMPVMVMRNEGGHFTDATASCGLSGTEGWWSSLVLADVNGDGRSDIVAGNLGLNSKFRGTPENPVHVYWADFDGNGRSDIVLAKEKEGHKLPVRGRECSSQQCPMILDKFPTYQEFARADLDLIYTPEKLAGALHLEARYMRSAVFINDGNGRFSAAPLPNIAQVAPVNGIVPLDVNGDGHLDLVVAGNHWGAEVETVRYDAGTGLVLLGDGTGAFSPMSIARSGFFAWGNVKDLALVRATDQSPLIVVANNNDVLQAFAPAKRASLSALSSK